MNKSSARKCKRTHRQPPEKDNWICKSFLSLLLGRGDFSSWYEKCICNYYTKQAHPLLHLSLRQLSHCLKSEIKPQQRAARDLGGTVMCKKAEAHLNGAAAKCEITCAPFKEGGKKLLRLFNLFMWAHIVERRNNFPIYSDPDGKQANPLMELKFDVLWRGALCTISLRLKSKTAWRGMPSSAQGAAPFDIGFWGIHIFRWAFFTFHFTWIQEGIYRNT